MSSVVMNEKSDEELNGCSRDSLEEEENKMEVEEEEDYDEASAGSDSERQEEDDDDEDEEDGGGKNEDDDDVVSPLIEGLSRGKSSSSISEVSDDACYKKGRGKEMSPPSRKRSSRMTRPPSRNGEYEDYDASFDGDVFDDADANGATAAAQEFFTARLAEFLQTHQDEKSPCSLNLWRIQVGPSIVKKLTCLINVFHTYVDHDAKTRPISGLYKCLLPPSFTPQKVQVAR